MHIIRYLKELISHKSAGNPYIAFMLLLIAQFFTIRTAAEKIDADRAAGIAERFFQSRLTKKGSHAIKPLSIAKGPELKTGVAGDPYYIFVTESGPGFVIVSADDSLQPIIGYSLDNNFDSENIPEGLAGYLGDYAAIAGALAEKGIEYKRATRGGAAVEPLMKVKWNQGEPYNRLVPMYGNDHAVTGCVATAMAQVMKYHNFPPSGHGVVTNNESSVELGYPYDWENMLDEYSYSYPDNYQYTDAQATAVATLMRDVGYAVNMKYGSSSAAYSTDIPAAMCRNFNYSSDIKYVIRETYTTQTWIDEIRNSLLRNEPVLYGGTDGKYGHQFVCDGIDTDDMLHINWGWGGSSDGYFDMNILSPSDLGIGAGNGAYFKDQDMVLNIRPGNPDADNLDKKFPLTIGRFHHPYSLPADGKLEGYFGLSVQIYNSTGSEINRGEYGLAICVYDKEGNCVYISQPSHVQQLPTGYTLNSFISINMSDLIEKKHLPDGQYTMSIASFAGDFTSTYDPLDVNMEAEKQPLNIGDLNNIDITIKDGEVYLDTLDICKENPELDVHLVSGIADGTFYAGSSATITLTVQNNSNHLLNNHLPLLLIPENEYEDGKLYDCTIYDYIGLYVYPGVKQDITIDMSLYNISPGSYRVLLAQYISDNENQLYGYKPLACDNPVIIEVKELPAEGITLTSKLQLGSKEIKLRSSIYIDFQANYYNAGPRFITQIQLWCKPEGREESEEILLCKTNDCTIYNGSHQISFENWCEDRALWLENLGNYEAYLKYIDPDGNTVTFDNENNHAVFTLVEDDADIKIQLASPLTINKGKAFKPDSWTTFDIEFELMSPTGATLIPDNLSILISKKVKGNEHINSFWIDRSKIEKTDLAPGEKTKITATMMYVSSEGDEDLNGLTLYAIPNWIKASTGYVYPIQLLPYLDSLSFKVDDGSFVEEVAADSDGASVTIDGSCITISDLTEDADIELYTLDGMKIAQKNARAGSVVSVEGVTGGVYILMINRGHTAPMIRKLFVR